jgi:hypothetical protein
MAKVKMLCCVMLVNWTKHLTVPILLFRISFVLCDVTSSFDERNAKAGGGEICNPSLLLSFVLVDQFCLYVGNCIICLLVYDVKMTISIGALSACWCWGDGQSLAACACVVHVEGLGSLSFVVWRRQHDVILDKASNCAHSPLYL